MIDENGHIRLIDFGFSKLLSKEKTYTNCGTPVYLAPEVITGQGHDQRADIWALGVLSCELLTG